MLFVWLGHEGLRHSGTRLHCSRYLGRRGLIPNYLELSGLMWRPHGYSNLTPVNTARNECP
jgi:hypothetical protein